jgi:hypothetical protein
MSDITLCSGKGCDLKKNCERYCKGIRPRSEDRYVWFAYAPYGTLSECKYFLEIEVDQKKGT